MDIGRIVQMIINQLIRKAVNTGVNAAVNRVNRDSDPGTPQDQAHSKATRQAAKRARQAINITRKL